MPPPVEEAIERLKERACAPRTSPSLANLRTLVRAWLFDQPFHNLDLLAATRAAKGPLTWAEAIERCGSGLGGPCHVHAAGFQALLVSLGFDAELCGATITSDNDHLIVRVRLEGRTWLCDVGNGQPYVEPFPSDSPSRFQHLGWKFETHLVANGIELRRSSPDQPEFKVVYRTTGEPNLWADFSTTIDRHHREPEFGPFLRGLRAVRIGAAEMIALRDTTLTFFREGEWSRIELVENEVSAVLRERLGLSQLRIDQAVAAWVSARRSAP